MEQQKITVDCSDFSGDLFSRLVLEVSLFDHGLPDVIFFDVLSHKDFREIIIKHKEDIKSTTRKILFVENKMPIKRVLQALDPKIIQVRTITNSQRQNKSTFELLDAFAGGETVRMISILRQQKNQGASIEEILGLFNWQLKSWVEAGYGDRDSNLKPFVKNKAVAFLRKTSQKQIIGMYLSFLQILSKRDWIGGEMWCALELWCIQNTPKN